MTSIGCDIYVTRHIIELDNGHILKWWNLKIVPTVNSLPANKLETTVSYYVSAIG